MNAAIPAAFTTTMSTMPVSNPVADQHAAQSTASSNPFADPPPAYNPAYRPVYIGGAHDREVFTITAVIKHCRQTPRPGIRYSPTVIGGTEHKFKTLTKITTAVEVSISTSLDELENKFLLHFNGHAKLRLHPSASGHNIDVRIRVPGGDAGMITMSPRNCRALLRICRDAYKKHGRPLRVEVRFGCVCEGCRNGSIVPDGRVKQVGKFLSGMVTGKRRAVADGL